MLLRREELKNLVSPFGFEADGVAAAGGAGGLDFDQEAPVSAQERCDPTDQEDGISADADVAVEEQRGAPAASAGEAVPR